MTRVPTTDATELLALGRARWLEPLIQYDRARVLREGVSRRPPGASQRARPTPMELFEQVHGDAKGLGWAVRGARHPLWAALRDEVRAIREERERALLEVHAERARRDAA